MKKTSLALKFKMDVISTFTILTKLRLSSDSCDHWGISPYVKVSASTRSVLSTLEAW